MALAPMLLGPKSKTKEETPKVGIIMITCPQTGHAIPTGITVDREKFRSSTVFFARTYCAICRANHEWFAREAWLCESSEMTEMVS
jgi:hypothetical protein